jgi:hypothetical protein
VFGAMEGKAFELRSMDSRGRLSPHELWENFKARR